MAVVWILLGWAGCVITALALDVALFRLLRVRLARPFGTRQRRD